MHSSRWFRRESTRAAPCTGGRRENARAAARTRSCASPGRRARNTSMRPPTKKIKGLPHCRIDLDSLGLIGYIAVGKKMTKVIVIQCHSLFRNNVWCSSRIRNCASSSTSAHQLHRRAELYTTSSSSLTKSSASVHTNADRIGAVLKHQRTDREHDQRRYAYQHTAPMSSAPRGKVAVRNLTSLLVRCRFSQNLVSKSSPMMLSDTKMAQRKRAR